MPRIKPLRSIVGAAVFLAAVLVFAASRVMFAAGTPPAVGDVIFNEYASDNDANGNDFFELLVLRDHVDLRGLRVTDNELVIGGISTTMRLSSSSALTST